MAVLGLALALGIAKPCLAQWSSVHFTIVAHEDDWQLFFNPIPWADMRTPGRKVVFVYLTAGDGGLGAGPAANPYLLAREEGAKRALRFIANMDSLSEMDKGLFAMAAADLLSHRPGECIALLQRRQALRAIDVWRLLRCRRSLPGRKDGGRVRIRWRLLRSLFVRGRNDLQESGLRGHSRR
jgi:hypothetical protein